MKEKVFDCLILGGGPAGLSAALYCARGSVDCAIVDSSCLGGSPINYFEIENYLGLGKIQGFDLATSFIKHVNDFNIPKFEYEEIESVDLISPIKKVKTLDKTLLAKNIIIATGAKPRKLGVRGEEENIGKGVSYCAVCDGAFYKNKIVAVVGGGNSALEEALYLTKFATKVYLIHRRQEFRADKIVQERVKNNPKIELVLNSNVVEILSDKTVTGVIIEQNNELKTLEIQGIFPYIGLVANCEAFNGQLQQNAEGFILTDECMKTSVDNVYCIGDIRNTPLRQVITAVSDGAIAGVEVSKNITKQESEQNESISIR